MTRSEAASPARRPVPGARRRVLPFLAAAVGAAILATGASPLAAHGTARQADEDACRPGVFRLCASEIPDETSIVRCLEREVRNLSPACRGVIDPEGHATGRQRRP